MQFFIFGILFFIIIFIFIFIFHYLKLKELHEITLTCTSKIDEALENKKNIVAELLDAIKNNALNDIYNIDDNMDLFTKEEILFDVSWNINKVLDEKPKEIKKKKVKELFKNLKSIDEEIEGLKDFYNVKMNIYNDTYNKKPFYFLYKMLNFYPGRNFKIKKIEDYEILKN